MIELLCESDQDIHITFVAGCLHRTAEGVTKKTIRGLEEQIWRKIGEKVLTHLLRNHLISQLFAFVPAANLFSHKNSYLNHCDE